MQVVAVGWGVNDPLGRNDVGNQLTEARESKISGQTTPFVKEAARIGMG